jgi:TetR/AcrR family transcriptional regulator, cholesterol catabolism regulator
MAKAIGDVVPTQERVLQAAARLFRTKGYAATTTREIAAELGIQKASLYYHITSKEDLLYRMCVASMREHLDGIQAIIDGPGDISSRLRATVVGQMSRLHSHSDSNAVALLEMRSLDPKRRSAVVEMRDEYEVLFRGLVEEAQAAGVLRSDIEAKYLALLLLSVINWSILWFRPNGRLRVDQLANMLLDIYLEGIKSEGTDMTTLRATAAGGR